MQWILIHVVNYIHPHICGQKCPSPAGLPIFSSILSSFMFYYKLARDTLHHLQILKIWLQRYHSQNDTYIMWSTVIKIVPCKIRKFN